MHRLTKQLRDALKAEGEGRGSVDVTDSIIDRIDEALSYPPIPELWGVTEVAACIGVTAYQNVYKKIGLPEPVMELQRGQLWLAEDIRAYAREQKEQKEDEQTDQ
jgi:hypothetical protein